MRPMILLMAAMASLAGCATAPQPSAPSPPSAPAKPAPPVAASGLSPALEAQRLRLVDALAGTPVTVAPTDTRQLRVLVPVKFAFDPASAKPKPPLLAVLDQVMTGYRPQSLLTEMRINAPGDGETPGALAQARARSVRDHLVLRGMQPARVVGLGQAGGAAVEILITDRVTVR